MNPSREYFQKAGQKCSFHPLSGFPTECLPLAASYTLSPSLRATNSHRPLISSPHGSLSLQPGHRQLRAHPPWPPPTP